MRRVLSVSLLSLLAVSCASTKPPKIAEPKIPAPTVNSTADKDNGIEVVKAKLLVKKDSLNHNVVENYITVSYLAGTTLDQICRDLSVKIPYSVVAEDQIKYLSLKAPVFGRYSLKELLNRISAQLGVYWTNDNGVIKFVQEKVVVYTFPVLSSGVISSLYSVDDKDNFDVKDQFFQELEKAVKNVLSFENRNGKIKTVVLYNSQQEKVNAIQKVNEKDRGEERQANYSRTLQREKHNDTSVNEKEEDKSTKINGNGISLKRGKENGKKQTQPIVIEGDKTNKVEQKKKAENKVETLKADTDHRLTKNNSSIQRKKAERNSRKIEETSVGKDTVKRTESIEINRVLNNQKKVAVIPSAGELVVRVSRDEEPMIDSIVKSMVKNTFDNLVFFKVYLVELDKVNKKDLELSLKFFKRAYRHETTVDLSGQSASISFTSLATNYLQGLAHGINLDSFINYITTVGKGKVINTSTLLSLPRTLSRIKSGVEYPYFEPETVSVGGTNPTLTYQVKYVVDGVEVRLLPTVIGDNIFVQFTAVLNQFLGYQDVQAGNMGTYKLPIQSPKVITSTVRCRPNDIIFVGGLKKYLSKNYSSANLGIARSDQNDREERELFIIVQPKLIKFE